MALMRSSFLAAVLALVSAFGADQAFAANFLVPESDSVLGEVQWVTAKHEDTLLDMGRTYGVGYEEIVAANPGVDPWLPGEGTQVLIPSRYILPEGTR